MSILSVVAAVATVSGKTTVDIVYILYLLSREHYETVIAALPTLQAMCLKCSVPSAMAVSTKGKSTTVNIVQTVGRVHTVATFTAPTIVNTDIM